MKLFAPRYYRHFSCIADKCLHSCCVGWEIDVDPTTLKKYDRLCGDYAKKIKKSICNEETPHFLLDTEERCPHLNENGLCRIILSYGEALLCDICREHPRFYHNTVRGKEVGIGMACEEACRLILSSDEYDQMVIIDEVDEVSTIWEFDAVAHRTHVFSILSALEMSFSDKLSFVSTRYQIDLSIHSDEEWRKILRDLEYLDESHRALFASYSSASIASLYEKELERAFAYFVYRHCSDAEDAETFCSSLGFALVCERLIASIAKSDPTLNIIEIARIVSEELEYSEENTERIKAEFFI